MAQTYNKMIIEIKEDITDIITAKQDDTNSRFLDVYLRDNGVPINLTGHEVKIYGRKADGTSFFNNGEITEATKGRCQFELTNQALAAVGSLALEISIWENNRKILTTQTFEVFVEAKIRNDSILESSNEFGALVLLFQKLYDFWADISDTIGQTNNTGGTTTKGTVMAKLNALLNQSGGIKSIQHGFVNTIDNGSTRVGYRDITITSVNTNKSILITDSGPVFRGGSMAIVSVVPYLYNSTTIRQNNASTTSNYFPSFNWSIVEFV